MVTNLQCYQIQLHLLNEDIFSRISVEKFFYKSNTIFFTCHQKNVHSKLVKFFAVVIFLYLTRIWKQNRKILEIVFDSKKNSKKFFLRCVHWTNEVQFGNIKKLGTLQVCRYFVMFFRTSPTFIQKA